ncbi:hypothetical protein R3P38DRAFT_2800181 [Favolaschia claudopus]|uniref:Uncharacterized protein n=1 Tax=Favolaschia claudopus TaxID=2862362 RepID=A0AAV9ZZ00_9AGAR
MAQRSTDHRMHNNDNIKQVGRPFRHVGSEGRDRGGGGGERWGGGLRAQTEVSKREEREEGSSKDVPEGLSNSNKGTDSPPPPAVFPLRSLLLSIIKVPPPLAILTLKSNETTATYNCLNARQYKAVIIEGFLLNLASRTAYGIDLSATTTLLQVLRSKCINLIKHVSLSAISSLASFSRRDRCVKAPQLVIRNYVDETPHAGTNRRVELKGTEQTRAEHNCASVDGWAEMLRSGSRNCTDWSVSGQTSPEGILTGVELPKKRFGRRRQV